jgi:putative GTP pyrophosphokinase
METPSKTKANKAGDELRNFSPSIAVFDQEDLERYLEAFDVLAAWRSAHQYPLVKATVGLRSMVKTVRCSKVEVSQRLKRTRTILDKLKREPGMELSRMQDIGGCRAVLQNVDELRRVENRLCANKHFVRSKDYIETPRSSGYRGVHVIVQYPDRESVDRRIEVQLRTLVMHDWAIAVEKFAGRLGEDLKSSKGPGEVTEWLAIVSEAMALEEAGEGIPDELMARIDEARRRAGPYLQGGRQDV